MRFTSALVAGFAAVASAIPATQVVTNTDTLTTKSRALQEPAKALVLLDGPLLATGQGIFPKIIQGFQDFITTTTGYINEMDQTKYNAADSATIYTSYNSLVQTHQELLNILIGKSGLFSTVPFIGQPMAAILRQDESVLDAYSFGLIDVMEAQMAEMQTAAEALSSTLDTAINSYSGLGQ